MAEQAALPKIKKTKQQQKSDFAAASNEFDFGKYFLKQIKYVCCYTSIFKITLLQENKLVQQKSFNFPVLKETKEFLAQCIITFFVLNFQLLIFVLGLLEVSEANETMLLGQACTALGVPSNSELFSESM